MEAAFENTDEIHWKQGPGIKKGDIVYMYVASPVSAILYSGSQHVLSWLLWVLPSL